MSSRIHFPQHQDWAGQVLPFVLAWGLPVALLVGAIFVTHLDELATPPRTFFR